jgi:LPXTG-site transpeptidase (sortase) family protein
MSNGTWKMENMRNKPLTFHLGNILMLAGIALIMFIYYPIVAMYVFPQKLVNYSHAKGMFIQIPKIAAQAPIIPNVDPWNEADYVSKLKQGVALAKGFALPGTGGVSYLFAHSSDVPWNITRYNTAFFRLGELEKGDVVRIYRDGTPYTYEIYNKETVWPNQVDYLKKGVPNGLILQTCTPIGTAFQRILLFAKMKS